MVKLDANPAGGIAFDDKFFVKWPQVASPAPGAARGRRLLVGFLLLSVSVAFAQACGSSEAIRVVMPGLVPGIQPPEHAGACGAMDPGDPPNKSEGEQHRDDTVSDPGPLARARGARGLPWPQSRHGLAVRRGARTAPPEPRRRLSVAAADRARARAVGWPVGVRLRAGPASQSTGARCGIASGLLLIGWAIYHWRYGHRHRVRFGMQTGLLGLGALVVPDGHGPRRRPHALAGAHAAVLSAAPRQPRRRGPVAVAVAGVAVHTMAHAGGDRRDRRVPSTNGSASRSCAAPGSTSMLCGLRRCW